MVTNQANRVKAQIEQNIDNYLPSKIKTNVDKEFNIQLPEFQTQVSLKITQQGNRVQNQIKKSINDSLPGQMDAKGTQIKQLIDSELPGKIKAQVTNELSKQLPGAKTQVHSQISAQLPAQVKAQVTQQIESQIENEFKDLISYGKEQKQKQLNYPTFCNGKVDGEYDHPKTLEKLKCYKDSLLIGNISNPAPVYGVNGIGITPVVYQNFFRGHQYTCKSIIIRDSGTIVKYDQNQTWTSHGINLMTSVLIMRNQFQVQQKWGFIDDKYDLNSWKKVQNLDKKLKGKQYTLYNLETHCLKQSKYVPLCYKELTINLQKNQLFQLYGIWDIQSIAQSSSQFDQYDNIIQYFMEIYCRK